MLSPVKEFKFKFPRDKIYNEYLSLKNHPDVKPIPIYGTDIPIPGFIFLPSNNILKGYVKEFLDYYEIPGTCDIDYWVHFMVVQKDIPLDWHIDEGILTTAVNIIANDTNVPVTYEVEGEFFYHEALLDVFRKHKVDAPSEDRIIFRITFFNPSYTYEYMYNLIDKKDNA